MRVTDQFHAPATYSREKIPQYSLHRTLGGPQSRSGRFREEILSCLCHSLVTTATELSIPVPQSVILLQGKECRSDGGTGNNLPKEQRHRATCYRPCDWGSIPGKTVLFLITSLLVSQSSSFTVDICNIPRNSAVETTTYWKLVLVSFTGYKTEKRVYTVGLLTLYPDR
jgi:hypothetical protein